MIDLLIRWRFAALVGAVVLLGGVLIWGRPIRYEQSLTAFFPEGDADVQAYERAVRLFGSDNLVFITYDDPQLLTASGMDRLAELVAEVEPGRISAVEDVQALDRLPLFWELDDRLIDLVKLPPLPRRLALRALTANVGTLAAAGSPLTVGGALRRAEGGALEALRDRVVGHPLMVGTVVSESGRSASVIVRLKPMDQHEPRETIAALRAAADRFAERHGLRRPALAGPPVLLADGYTAIDADGRRLATVGMLLIAIVLISVTRSLWWAVVPILSGWVVWRIAESALAALDIRLSLSSGPLSSQIVVLTMPAASHLAIHFREALRRSGDRWEATRASLRHVSVPILWTALAGTIGYGALLSSRVVPVWQFGLILAVCTLMAALLTLGISPIAMLPPFRLELPVRVGSVSRLGRLLSRPTWWVIRHPGPVVGVIVLTAAPVVAGMVWLRYESNYVNAFKKHARPRMDYEATEARLGGIGVVSLVVPFAGEFGWERLREFWRLDQRLRTLRGENGALFDQVVSPATVLDPEGKIAALDDERAAEALRIKLELIGSSPQAALLRNFVSEGPGGGWARVVLRLSERRPALEKQAAFEAALAAVAEEQDVQVDGREPFLAGLSQLLTQTTRGVMETSWVTFVWSAVGILLVLGLAFRSVWLALLAIVPTLLAVGLVLGITGWLRIPLDLATALVASVALGLSVDDTFHCLLQYRRRRAAGEAVHRAIRESYLLTGPGVLLSSLAVAVGFSVLRVSEFVPFSNFGTMVGIATLGSTLGNLLLLPAFLSLGGLRVGEQAVGSLERRGGSGSTGPSIQPARLEPEA
ncbi:MAG: membrane protein [Isosphaeraceae bacterium]|nr:MAG: membrane protein [Isosphaeraceae bacterium]